MANRLKQLLGIPYLVGKIKFKFLFHGTLAWLVILESYSKKMELVNPLVDIGCGSSVCSKFAGFTCFRNSLKTTRFFFLKSFQNM